MTNWLNCCSFFRIDFCIVSEFLLKQHLWIDMNFMKLKYDSVCCMNSSRDRNVNDTVYLDWLFVNFIKREFSIVVLVLNDIHAISQSCHFSIWNCIAIGRSRIRVISKSSKKLLIDVVIWYSDKNILFCSCCSRRSINSWKCSWYFDFWYRHRSAKIEVIVLEWLFDDLNIEYEKFISHKCFDKLRRLFQSF